MTLLAIQTLLYRYTQQEDITNGFIANHNRSEIEGLVVLLARTYLGRDNVSGTVESR